MKLIYCVFASATLHAAALTMTSFPSGNLTETLIPVHVLVSYNEASGGPGSKAKPAKGAGAGQRLAAKVDSQRLSVATINDAGSNGASSPPVSDPPLQLHLDIPVSDISEMEMQTGKTALGASALGTGAGGSSRPGAQGGGSPFGSEGGSGTGQGSGGEALTRAYAKADYAHNPVPEYPERARRQGWEGTVLLDVLITREGKPAKIEIRESSGFELLDKAAAQAVMGWRFHPAHYGTTALEGWVKVPIVFRLRNKRD